MNRREMIAALLSAPLVAKACVPLPIDAIHAGAPRETALEAFRQNVNRPPLTMFSTEHWLTPKLAELRGLLPEVLNADHAQGLLDVLHGRSWMREIIPWLRSGSPVPLLEFVRLERMIRFSEIGDLTSPAFEKIHFLNDHDCLWFPDGTRGGIDTPLEVLKFYDEEWKPGMERPDLGSLLPSSGPGLPF